MDLLKQSGESLAGGRVSYLELQPFDITETGSLTEETDRLWRRGGFAGSLLAISEQQSIRWRNDFIRSYLERDIPQFGLRMPGERLRRLWTMLAHDQGTLLNTAQLARNIGVDTRTAGGHIDLLVDLLLVRRLQPWQANIGKRLVKSPKVYVRDSGLVHALLAIRSQESLLSHPVVGASWEGFVIENLLAIAPEGVHGFFSVQEAAPSWILCLSSLETGCGQSRLCAVSPPDRKGASTSPAGTSSRTGASSSTPAMQTTPLAKAQSLFPCLLLQGCSKAQGQLTRSKRAVASISVMTCIRSHWLRQNPPRCERPLHAAPQPAQAKRELGSRSRSPAR